MSTARIDTANANISTYGDATRNYTVFNTWEGDTEADLVTAQAGEVLECYDDQASFNDLLLISGATTNATYFRIVRAASGHGHDGTPNNGFTVANESTTTFTFESREAHSSFQDIIGKLNTNTASNLADFLVQGAAANRSVIGCISIPVNTGSGSSRGFLLKHDDIRAILCMAHGASNDGFALDSAAGETVYAYNCVSQGNSANGFDNGAGINTCVNCISDGNSLSGFAAGDYTNSSNNASSDGTAPGGSSRINQTFTFINVGNDDFHLSTDDTGGRNFGTDLSADSIFAFDDDINDGIMGGSKSGELFNIWDIGMDEPEPAVGEIAVLLDMFFRHDIDIVGY